MFRVCLQSFEENIVRLKNRIFALAWKSLSPTQKIMGTDSITLPERMIRLETQIEWIKSDINTVNSSVVELKTLIIQNSKDSDDRYASKMTENIVFWMVGIILITFMTAVVTYFIRKSNADT